MERTTVLWCLWSWLGTHSWALVSFADFIKTLLTIEAARRPEACEASRHRFLSDVICDWKLCYCRTSCMATKKSGYNFFDRRRFNAELERHQSFAPCTTLYKNTGDDLAPFYMLANVSMKSQAEVQLWRQIYNMVFHHGVPTNEDLADVLGISHAHCA